jgi:hypothetical protein
LKEYEALNSKLAEKVKKQKILISNLEDLPEGSHPDSQDQLT